MMPHDNVKLVYGSLGFTLLWIGPSYEQPPIAVVDWDCDDARKNARENAARICLTWNMHDELVAALESFPFPSVSLEENKNYYSRVYEWHKRNVKPALAKAGVK